MQAPPKRADVPRITDRALDHEGQNFEILRAHFFGSFNLEDNVRRRAQKDILPQPGTGNGFSWLRLSVRTWRSSRRSSVDAGRPLRGLVRAAQSELRLGSRYIALRNPNFGRGFSNIAQSVPTGERAPIFDGRRTE